MRDFDQMSLLFNMKFNGAKANLKKYFNSVYGLSLFIIKQGFSVLHNFCLSNSLLFFSSFAGKHQLTSAEKEMKNYSSKNYAKHYFNYEWTLVCTLVSQLTDPVRLLFL